MKDLENGSGLHNFFQTILEWIHVDEIEQVALAFEVKLNESVNKRSEKMKILKYKSYF